MAHAAPAESAAAALAAMVQADHAEAVARLTYVDDSLPGWTRVRRGRGFAYLDEHGRAIKDAEALRRIRRLAIPPAYTQVWICPSPDGHIQATARDARGRKQYRYHELWQELRNADKFDRMREFGEALPRIRRAVRRDLGLRGLPRDKVLATIVRLLDTTYLRVGNDEYARTNGSYGLTTLRDRHAAIRGSKLRLRFRGKSGVQQEVELDDPQVARIVRQSQDLPGQELFQYLDEDGEHRPIGSADVNDYLRRISGGDFSAKDFRTWHASALTLERLHPCDAGSRTEARQLIKNVIAEVAGSLGHTQAVCRKSYVHPQVLAHFLEGRLRAVCEARSARPAARQAGLRMAERQLLALLAGGPVEPASASASAPAGSAVRSRSRAGRPAQRKAAPPAAPLSA
jgi:DNA topoisomerase-1